ncbi:polysaccharide deacetylase family protein [Lamprocystis purpurea]|jgi:hypothetical protein|uniref:polysaccharide deacetylase family protein n=1 Tax=Lamprocystis purpurea TaxID=61598 RepID=UPI00035CF1AC|nr:polysaccharide deacetylase family protein [Lamprocystis purpurea]
MAFLETEKMKQSFDSGYFLFSLDTEFAWGHYDYDDIRARLFSPDGSRERRKVEKILKILNEFGIVGTWAIVGHMWFDRCMDCEVCPILEWRNRYSCADQIIGTDHPLWYARDMIEGLLNSPNPQEIGFHGYTHTPFSQGTMSTEAARIEINEGVRVAGLNGVKLTAMVFPRNRIGHLNLLREAGFTCFRGAEVWPRAYYRKIIGNFLRHFNHYVSVLSTPQVYLPSIDDSGLVNLPASRWLFGLNRRVDHALDSIGLSELRVNSMIRGIRRAAREKKVIHLYAHPYEFENEHDFDKLRRLAAAVAEEVALGHMRSVGMTEMANIFIARAK